MFRHVVLLRLDDRLTAPELTVAVAALRELPRIIPDIRSYQVGVDAGLSPGNARLSVIADFADEAAYVRYRDHPAHQSVIAEHLSPVLVERLATQYPIGPDGRPFT